jgi:type I restriction enzyme, S subunit
VSSPSKRLAFRDSGIPWLGKIPAHWRVAALKHIVSVPITDGPHETPEFVDSGIPFVSAEAVWDGRVHLETVRGYISYDVHDQYSKKYRPEKNDIYVVKSGATTGKVAIVDLEDEFSIWSPLAAVRCDREQALPRFVFHLLVSEYFQGQVRTAWSLGTQPNIGMEVLENLCVVLPPLNEQHAIANYLDHETERIDALVAAKERVLDLVAEKRRALITCAVTRGLDSCAPLRDSGIPWLGEIPAH